MGLSGQLLEPLPRVRRVCSFPSPQLFKDVIASSPPTLLQLTVLRSFSIHPFAGLFPFLHLTSARLEGGGKECTQPFGVPPPQILSQIELLIWFWSSLAQKTLGNVPFHLNWR